MILQYCSCAMPYPTAVNDVFSKRLEKKAGSHCFQMCKFTTVLKRRGRSRQIKIISSNSGGKVPKLV